MIDESETPTLAGVEGWFVVRTASRAEKKVVSRIAALGIEPWLPTVTQRRRWSDRWRELVTPLFPGYLFARGTVDACHRLLLTPGVVTVVREGGRPALLTDGFVDSLRRAVSCVGVEAEQVVERAAYQPGHEVIVQTGALAGARGVVRERRNGRQLVIWVHAIGRGVAFVIGSADVLPSSGKLA